ncbi:BTB/POZ domain-containing protein 6-like [Haliotis asinina]|uniref:BTB/POZ domain-containing protein 6-like n=1 Tax=Haliotis asinina TaxID=109174 RepID=UPI003531E535
MADVNVQQAAMTAGIVDNWQGGKTLAECNLRMFVSEDSCDVTFRVGSSGQVIKAHSYVLISRSCVFHAMFTGSLAERSDVSVPDIEPGVFNKFILYIYTDNTTVDAHNVTALLYASRKYTITGLESQCTQFLEQNLDVDNACLILDVAHSFDLNLLFRKAFTLILKKGDRSLRSTGFLALSKVLVDQIVESDDLTAWEPVIFNAVNSWAEAECGRQRREVTPEAKRTVLGESLLFKVRFPLLKHTFMAKDVKRSGLLTDLERLRILEYIGCPDNGVEPFNNKQRRHETENSTTHSVTRFGTECRLCGWSVNDSLKDAISFRSSQDIMLYGYRLYGPKREHAPTTYSVTTYFGNEENVLHSMIQDRAAYTVNSKVFDVAFEEPVAMRAGVWYTLVVIMKGRLTFMGQDGKGELQCPNRVTFTFKNSELSSSGTSVTDGQIPSLLYRIP